MWTSRGAVLTASQYRATAGRVKGDTRMKRWRMILPALWMACSSSPSGTPGSAGSGGGTGGNAGGNSGGAAAGGAGTGGGGAAAGAGGASATSDAGAGGGGVSTGPTAADACAALADAACAKLEACSPFAVGALYGDVTRCRERLAVGCLPSFGASGTSATPARTSACAQSLAALPCATLSRGDFGPACAAQPGTLAAGGACGDDAQCASAFCARAADAICGVCAAATRAGDPCVRGACSAGTACPAGQTMCIAPVAGQAGDACTVAEECDLVNAVGCDTVDRRCIRLTLATGACGANALINPTSYATCPASGTCSALLAGTCAAAAADGATCSTGTSGPACTPPARCVSGRCTLPAPASCR